MGAARSLRSLRWAVRQACTRAGPTAGCGRPVALLVCCGLTVALLAGCGGAGAGPGEHGRLQVVAAENFWGSIASQLGGDRVEVKSIIVNPQTDPHSYEPTAKDARVMAGAQLVIVNGLGYDSWASRLLAADSAEGRVVLDVGRLLGLHEGANPHRWYFPADVRAVIAQIAADYNRLDPRDAAYFAARRKAYETVALARYDRLREQIRRRYAGVPVGYSESVFQGLGEDLGLRLITPRGFVKAIAEGTEVSARDKQTVDEQAEARKIAVWVFNSQNVTPDVRRVNEIARAHRIPIATVTETLSPQSATFQRWQSSQLEELKRALHAATGR
jgi:zinc/manganese transport system substrate-binding protein